MTDAPIALHGYQHYFDMLSDEVRMQAFRSAIHAAVQPGDRVVDLGAGTGLLGIWALQAGAAEVHMIEASETIDLAREIVGANGFSDRVVFHQANSRDVELDEPADLLVSETLGSHAFDENTLPFTIDARERLLKPGGRMIPQRIECFCAPFESSEIRHRLDFWKEIDGVDFTPAFELFARKIMVETVPPNALLSAPTSLGVVDLRDNDLDRFAARVYVQMTRPGTIHAVAAFYRAELTDEIGFSTAPDQPATHWKQAVLPLREPIDVVEGDVMEWMVILAPKGEREDDTVIHYEYRCTQIGSGNGT